MIIRPVRELDDALFNAYLREFLKDAIRRGIDISAAQKAAEEEREWQLESKKRDAEREKAKRKRSAAQ